MADLPFRTLFGLLLFWLQFIMIQNICCQLIVRCNNS